MQGEAGVARAFMRWLLEPAALGQAMESLSPADLRAKQERVKKAQYHHNAPRRLERLEVDLHGQVCSPVRNEQLGLTCS